MARQVIHIAVDTTLTSDEADELAQNLKEKVDEYLGSSSFPVTEHILGTSAYAEEVED